MSDTIESTKKNKHEIYWTQAEVARRFRKSEGTIKNWRDQGLLSFFRPPGSRSVLYLAEEIRDFEKQHTTKMKGGITGKISGIKREKPVVSANQIDEDWRI